MARKGENIHKRKDGRWEGRYIKSRTAEGRIVWGYLYGKSYNDVKQKLIPKKAESGFYHLTDSKLTFEAFSEVWLCSIQRSIKESTYSHYCYTLHKYLLPVLGTLKISALDEAVLEQSFRIILSPADQSHKPLGLSSAKECLSMLRRICKYAAHLHLIRPMELCVHLPQEKKSAEAPLSLEEQKALRAFVLNAPTPRKIGLLLSAELGLRIGEVCGLKWCDFDWDAGIFSVRRTVSRISDGNRHTKRVVQPPKTRTSRREIPIPNYLLPILRNLREGFSENAWFLSGSEDKPVEPRCYRKSIRCYLIAAGVRPVRPHTLRHTFATTCLVAGCDIKTLSELLGHANASITLKCYVHSDLTRKRQEIDRIYSACLSGQ